MFRNIGKKIKVLAIVLCAIKVAILAISAFSLIGSGLSYYRYGEELVIYGILLLLAGPILAWLTSFFLYGFGELIDKTAENAKNTAKLVSYAEREQTAVPKAPVYQEATPTYQAPIYQATNTPTVTATPSEDTLL